MKTNERRTRNTRLRLVADRHPAAICTLGVIEIYSATQGSSLAGMHTKQIRWLVIGFILMFVLSRLDYHLILDQAWILYLIGIVALIAVLLFGHTRFGAKRWLPVLGELFQVSELVKLIIIIWLARFFAEVRTDELSLRDLIKAGLLVGFPLGLILKQPDLGTALVLMPLLVVGAFLGGLQWQHAAIISLAGYWCRKRFLSPGEQAYFEAVPERENHFLPASRRRRKRLGLSVAAIEDSRGFRRLLGQRFSQRHSESTGLHPRPLFRFHHVGVG